MEDQNANIHASSIFLYQQVEKKEFRLFSDIRFFFKGGITTKAKSVKNPFNQFFTFPFTNQIR